jgi:Fe-S-cluster containining protein
LKEENGFFTCRIYERKDLCGEAERPQLCRSYPQTFLNNLDDTLLNEIEACPILQEAVSRKNQTGW